MLFPSDPTTSVASASARSGTCNVDFAVLRYGKLLARTLPILGQALKLINQSILTFECVQPLLKWVAC